MQSVQNDFEQVFSKENLLEIFRTQVSNSRATGVDQITVELFVRNLSTHINIISRKALNGTYTFTRYKLKLISKGPNKFPREICIPTIRDLLALKALNQFLQCRLGDKILSDLPQSVIKNTKHVMADRELDTVVKLDVKDFYPSINHNILLKRVRKFIRYSPALSLIECAISTSAYKNDANESGIPQGLPISNILSAIYMRNLDNTLAKESSFFYYRYVDDILLIASHREAKGLKDKIIANCKRSKLTVYDPDDSPDKSFIGSSSSTFSYLGYVFNPPNKRGVVSSVRTESKERLINSIIGLFTSYKRSKKKSIALLQWKVNLRIAGCVSEGKCKGWLFFFSQIDDMQLLYDMDSLVNKMKSRFKVSFKTRKFSRAWHEIQHNRSRSNYFPNFDIYEIEEMKEIVATHKMLPKGKLNLKDAEIEAFFWKIIRREVRDMDIDVLDFGKY